MNNCIQCEAAYLPEQLVKRRCPTCRKDNRLMYVLMALVIPLLLTWGWMMLVYHRPIP